MRRLDGIINSVDMTLNKLWRWGRIGKPGVLLSMGSQSQDMTEQLNNKSCRSWWDSGMEGQLWSSLGSGIAGLVLPPYLHPSIPPLQPRVP